MEAFKTEIINDKGDIEEISIKTELERQDFMTLHSYRDFKDIEDFKRESEYVKNQKKLNIDRNLTEDLHTLFKKCRYGHILLKRNWKPERWVFKKLKDIKDGKFR